MIQSHSASVRSVGYGLAFIPRVYGTDATYGRLFKQPLRSKGDQVGYRNCAERFVQHRPAVFLFYRAELPGRWICAVTKRLNAEGFLITTYPTDAIKEGERVWNR